MKTLINKIALALVLAGSLTACKKDFLERSPFDSLTPDQALASEDALATALNGAYSRLRTASFFGRDLPIINDVHSDNAYVEQKNAGRYLLWYNYTITDNDGNAANVWTIGYQAILRANRIIDADVTGGSVPEIKSQARAIRALSYFELVNMFARPYTDNPSGMGVPLVLNYDPTYYPSRSTVGEVYTQIVSDLTAAIADAPAYTKSTLLSKYAMEGLLAKVYLYMGDYANALSTAQDVINNSGFTLVSAAGFQAYWQNASGRTDKVETLFEVDADVINNNGFDDIGAIYINGYQDIYASQAVYDLYTATDARRSVLIVGNTKSGSPAVIVNKYPNGQSDDRDNLTILRLSDVYLVAAEAAARTNSDVVALGYLNNLMAVRDPATVYASSGATLIDDIITERRKELAFEGDRLFDLNRLMRDITRVANPGAIPGPLSIPYSDDMRIAPIPRNEIQANANIASQQNPGY